MDEVVSKSIEDLVIYAAKLQIARDEHDVDRWIGAQPDQIVDDIVKQCNVNELHVNMMRIRRAAKAYKKKFER